MKYRFMYDSANCRITSGFLRDSIRQSQIVRFDMNIFKSNADIAQLLEAMCDRSARPCQGCRS